MSGRLPGVWLAAAPDCRRIGLKGPRAPSWLQAHGIAVPPASNSWAALGPTPGEEPGLLARLGAGEFLLEQPGAAGAIEALERALASAPVGVYPVLREDTALLLGGDSAHAVLAEVCSFDFASLVLDGAPLVMTMMAGVAVLVIPQEDGSARRYRIWCDPSFGPWLASTLGEIVREAGGEHPEVGHSDSD